MIDARERRAIDLAWNEVRAPLARLLFGCVAAGLAVWVSVTGAGEWPAVVMWFFTGTLVSAVVAELAETARAAQELYRAHRCAECRASLLIREQDDATGSHRNHRPKAA